MRQQHSDFDVVIVGGGGSGLATAASAAEAGLRVCLLEKRSTLGGTTGIAVGSLTANRTAMQKYAGIEDSLQDHVEDAGRFAPPEIENRNAVELRRFFLSHTAETLDWLRGMGLVFHGPSPEPPNRVPRMHNIVPDAKAYIAALETRMRYHGGTILYGACVESLLRNEGRVCGVVVDLAGQRVEYHAARGVVLAAGDYANAPDVIARFKGERFAEIEGINPHASGDGHALAESVGAKLVNMDVTYGPELRFVAPHQPPYSAVSRLARIPPLNLLLSWLTPLVPGWVMKRIVKRLIVTWQHPENSLFDDGAILVNAGGERFCDETAWPDREIAVARQPDKVAYLLLDERLRRRYSEWPHFVSTAPQIAYAYVKDYLELRPDVSVEAESLEDLAEKVNLPIDALRESAASMTGDRWVLLGPVKAYFTTTEGGAAIDTQFQVLDDDRNPIPGLYAVGQNGLGGQILWGHGLHIAWAITSGRLCGRVLAGTT